ncbi:ParB/RepB/Spo0J family partition protein [Loigolactobacillus coryniformis subsp. coryniformis]|jgi:ParB family chromosome partitioning protein|uniref:Chromosome partitioning protein, DNA-binding exonuclease n=2 Tax=Loigolactobacillus coryniformis TaxID=1610 RepID=J2Z873_9LACO|nr:ParB/RepB/Spo0J family partition protein [Loigolactobacillus coryniformis]MDT3392442.1 ParB/RepB/Spo0J family partition protein [Bacillota bacterium]RRG03470.1 MAG: ParB/RepB/Spo0J family partition protein [Lactobacillus sp.]EJN56788.1 Chromosome partitioning protein, DNA-binding exonuclease [Loigolactobacillus coryniformis subsp. coryniformis CECT 5711]MBW4801417.1 ParB/RepB/Spo0J family partition protein [Loigolactobacillus coryniformis subsp. torquens]MBW4804118.1 ParB/RepB/Spo0J family 
MSKQNKSLGRGMDALFSDFDDFATPQASEQVTALALSEIRPNPYQPRRQFDTTALQELADSIKENGVFQPVIVRKSINGYELIAGERRFRASKLAGKNEIPALVREVDEPLMMEIAVLENLQREDLNPLEEAAAYDMLMKKLHLTQEQVATRLGKSRPYIANYLRLLTLPAEVKKLVEAHALSMGQARTLLGLKDKGKMAAVAQRAIKEPLTVRELERLVSQLNAEKPAKPAPKPLKSPYLKASETQLQQHFGTKVNIAAHGDKGKIEINYLSTEDLNRILDLLGVTES